MVDPLGVQEVERLPDVGGRSLFTGVRHGSQPFLPRTVINRLELGWRVSNLRGVEANREDPLTVGQRLGERLRRGLDAQVPEKTEDQSAGDLEPVASVLQCPMDAVDHGLEGHPAVDVGLRVEENLGVANSLGGGPRQISPRQVIEVPLLQQHLATGVIDVEERLKIAEDIGSS